MTSQDQPIKVDVVNVKPEEILELRNELNAVSETSKTLANAITEAGIGRKATSFMSVILVSLGCFFASIGGAGTVSYCLNDPRTHTFCKAIPGYAEIQNAQHGWVKGDN